MFADYFTVVVCYDDIKRGVTDNVSSIGKSETAKETTILQWWCGGLGERDFLIDLHLLQS